MVLVHNMPLKKLFPGADFSAAAVQMHQRMKPFVKSLHPLQRLAKQGLWLYDKASVWKVPGSIPSIWSLKHQVGGNVKDLHLRPWTAATSLSRPH